MKLATNAADFATKAATALTEALNAEKGQKIVERLLEEKILKNPNLTPEEWEEAKKGMAQILFLMLLKSVPAAGDEFAGHLWNEMRKE